MSAIIIGLGELLWDLLPTGRQLGGAPANFAYHARALGAEGHVISRVGRDVAGRELLDRLKDLGIPTQGIEIDPSEPTGTVTVELTGDGQPGYTIHEKVAWDNLEGGEAGRQLVQQASAVCFGSLAQRSETARGAIRRLLRSAPKTALLIFDVNLRQHFHSREIIEESLRLANVLKVNDAELPQLATHFQLGGGVREQIVSLAERFGLGAVALTRGPNGSLLYCAGEWSDRAGTPLEIVDTVGAGDSFTAAMCMGLLAGWPLVRVHECAIEVADYVCLQSGATPSLPETLRTAFRGALS